MTTRISMRNWLIAVNAMDSVWGVICETTAYKAFWYNLTLSVFFLLYVQKFRWGNEQSSVAVVFRAVRDQRNGALFVGVSSDSGTVNDGWFSRTIQMKLNVCLL